LTICDTFTCKEAQKIQIILLVMKYVQKVSFTNFYITTFAVNA